MAPRTFATHPRLLVVSAALLLAAVRLGHAATITAFLRSSAALSTQVKGSIGDEAVARGLTGDLGRVASNGTHVFIAEATASRVYSRKISRTADGSITTGAPVMIIPAKGKLGDDYFTTGWDSGFSGDGGRAINATIANPSGVALDGSMLYIVDTNNCRIRRVNLNNGLITTVAGNGNCTPITRPSQKWDNAAYPGTQVPLSYPQDIATDGWGGLYIADTGNRRVRRLDIATGTVTTLAGPGPVNPAPSFSGDYGPAKNAVLLKPIAVAVYIQRDRCSPFGCQAEYPVVFIADQDAHIVRRLNTSSGIIIPVAGKWRTAAVDDALAYQTPVEGRSALLRGPRGVTVDPRDGSSVWIADYAHVHVLSGTRLTTITSNKRYVPYTIGPLGVPLSTYYADRFKHVYLFSDEQYSGPGAYSLWLTTAQVTGGASSSYYFDPSYLAVSTVNLDTYVFGRKTPPLFTESNTDL